MATPSNVFVAFLSQKLEAGGSETTIYLDRVTTKTGETISTSDFATFSRGIVTINPDGDGSTSYPEYCSFTAVDTSALTLTGVTRGLSSKSNSVVTANKRFHPVGTPVVFSFGSHNIQDLIDYIDDADAALTVGTANVATGTAGETITAGQLVYLKNDGKWWLVDADTAATVENVQLGIAQGAGAADAAITNGVMRKGRDTNQTGLVAGTTYYASNTAGAISSSAGTNSKVVGVAKSATELYFDPEYHELPTGAEKAAMAGGGDFGTPSTSNKFLTQDVAKDTDTRFTQRDVFTSSGTFTTPAGVSRIKVKVWGAGAGASGTDDTDATAFSSQNTAHGQPGNYAEAIVTVTDSQQFTVTVGSGGTGDTSYDYNHAGPGGASTVVDTATGASVFTLTCNGGASTIAYGAAGTISGSALISDSAFTVIGAGAGGGLMPEANNSSAQTGGSGANAVVIIEY